MRVTPVLDVMNGVVVHAYKGERSRYKPLESRLCSSVDPIEVARTFYRLGFREIYVADLDAIERGELNRSLYSGIREAGLKLMLDAGVRCYRDIPVLLRLQVDEVVVGSETMSSLDELRRAVAENPGRVTASIDVKAGVIQSPIPEVRRLGVEEYADVLAGLGVRSAILLELSKVGSGSGVDSRLVGRIVDRFDRLYVGGGVRSIEDLEKLESLGVYGVLVATALHRGWITVEELRSRGYL